MHRAPLLAAILASAALLPLASTAGRGAPSAQVSFTAAQAKQGQQVFTRTCAACHGAKLEGGAGPALTGPNFKTLSTRVHATVGDVFTYMTSNMPLNEPASLPHAQYVSIMAYILSKNGFKAGGKALTYTSAEKSKSPVVAR